MSGTLELHFCAFQLPPPPALSTCASWPYPLPSFKCYAAVDLPVTGARIQFVVRVSLLFSSSFPYLPRTDDDTMASTEVKTGIQQSAKILRCTATGWSFELSSGGADNKLYCGDQKYNYFVSYLFLHHNSSDKSRHPDRMTTMSGGQLLLLVVVDLGKLPCNPPQDKHRKIERVNRREQGRECVVLLQEIPGGAKS